MADFTYPCPTCKTPKPWTDNPYRPFCSDRCKLIDLGAWADESYKMPANTSDGNDSTQVFEITGENDN